MTSFVLGSVILIEHVIFGKFQLLCQFHPNSSLCIKFLSKFREISMMGVIYY
jgi:hypothetical protein